MNMQDNAVKMSLPAIPPVVVGLIVGLAIGLVGGYFIPREQAQSASPLAQQGKNTTPAASQQEQAQPSGFYGKVASINGSTFTAQEVLGANKPGTRTFTVTTSDATKFTYQKPNDSKDPAQSPFTPVDGKLADIKKDWYLYVAAANPLTDQNVAATQVIYSEKSPFKE
jgi:hypothetical protein